MRLEDFDPKDILICDIIVTDLKGKRHRKKMVYSKEDHEEDVNGILKDLKIKTAKSIEIIPIKKIGHKNA